MLNRRFEHPVDNSLTVNPGLSATRSLKAGLRPSRSTLAFRPRDR
ncbi:hypothetical protein BJP36_42135 [Moorena producens JHB]|uniref:Uncharacterized protein n=1 Tax=Moorena producens (strain JHB) TaxID=1454205 RepID=A0A9Q9UVL3_MOOP1|nr:hypothetical protein [Moorena producens]WAN68960.1 hypothetical protein BJP36_42135 [Moorena producens JHB]